MIQLLQGMDMVIVRCNEIVGSSGHGANLSVWV